MEGNGSSIFMHVTNTSSHDRSSSRSGPSGMDCMILLYIRCMGMKSNNIFIRIDWILPFVTVAYGNPSQKHGPEYLSSPNIWLIYLKSHISNAHGTWSCLAR